MAARLILVKHAMPRIDEARPSKDWVLGEEGRAAATALGEALRPYSPSAVVTSTEPKARETGERIAAVLGLPLSVDEDLVETKRETVGFLGRDTFEAGIQRFFAEPASLVFGEETADEAYARFDAAISRQRVPSPQVIVCHGTVISLWLSRRSGADAMGMWRSLKLPHALVLGEGWQVLDSIAVGD